MHHDCWTSFFIVYFKLGYSSGYLYDSAAFLFSLVNKPGWQPLKLDQTGQYSYRKRHSIDCSLSYGPTFGGGHDIRIYNNAVSNTNSYTNLGYTYSPPSGYSYGSSFSQSFLAGSYTFRPDEVEVFYETTWRNRGACSLSFFTPCSVKWNLCKYIRVNTNCW